MTKGLAVAAGGALALGVMIAAPALAGPAGPAGPAAAANTELENTTPDVPLVFGAHSWQAREAENAKLANKAQADFMGLLAARHAGRLPAAGSARPGLHPARGGRR
jgi:hypothetical protein